MANDYNNKRYYWIKLRDTFMTSDAVDFLMGQKEGANYVVLYQMLCLKTINTDGELSRTIGEMIIPYDIDKIVRDTKWFSKDTIIVALELYKKLGLVFANENGNLVITNFNKLVGSETQNAVYKQEKALLENFQLNSNRYKDIKILEIRDKNKDINKEKTNKKENDKIILERFDEFWKRYPRKINKAKAMEWYLKHKPDEQTQKDIIWGIMFSSGEEQWKKDNGQFIPYPITFLNQKRWEDFKNE